MYSKSLYFSKFQIKTVLICIINNNKLFLIKSHNNLLKYFLLPFDIFVDKHEYGFILRVKTLLLKVFLDKFFFVFSNFYKNNNRFFVKKLILKGLGYKILKIREGLKSFLAFKLGFSHLISFEIPQFKLEVVIKKNVLLLKSQDLIFLGNFSKNIKNLRLPNPYNGKGFWWKHESKALKIIKKK